MTTRCVWLCVYVRARVPLCVWHLCSNSRNGHMPAEVSEAAPQGRWLGDSQAAARQLDSRRSMLAVTSRGVCHHRQCTRVRQSCARCNGQGGGVCAQVDDVTLRVFRGAPEAAGAAVGPRALRSAEGPVAGCGCGRTCCGRTSGGPQPACHSRRNSGAAARGTEPLACHPRQHPCCCVFTHFTPSGGRIARAGCGGGQ